MLYIKLRQQIERIYDIAGGNISLVFIRYQIKANFYRNRAVKHKRFTLLRCCLKKLLSIKNNKFKSSLEILKIIL